MFVPVHVLYIVFTVPGFYYSFKKIMFSKTSEECKESFSSLVHYCSDVCPTYLKYVESLMVYKHLWVDCHRIALLRKMGLEHIDLEDNTLNQTQVEIVSSYVYDQILLRIRNLLFSLPEVLNFVIHHFLTYYSIRILKFINNVLPKSMLSKYLEIDEDPPGFSIQPSDFDQDCYFVIARDDNFYVDYRYKLCSCSKKCPLGPCVHINRILQHMYQTDQYISLDPEHDLAHALVSDVAEQYTLSDKGNIFINTYFHTLNLPTKFDDSYQSPTNAVEINCEDNDIEYVTLTDVIDTQEYKTKPDEENSSPRKRKLDDAESSRPNTERNVVLSSGDTSKIIKLENFLTRTTNRFKGAIIQRKCDNNPQHINSIVSLSDNVIIIDPKLGTIDYELENDMQKFDRIYQEIKSNPSQYKTVIKNMITVYDTFFGD